VNQKRVSVSNIVFRILTKTLEVKNFQGFLLLKGEKMLEQNKKPKENKFILAPSERAALLESKIDRANAQLQAMIAQIEAMKRIKQKSK
jgi:hypothetical protein